MSPALLAQLWWVPALGLAVVLFSVLAALLERSGLIRLRHWVEEGGERLRRLTDDRARFGAFRLLLGLLAKMLPLILLWLLLSRGPEKLPFGWLLAGIALFLLAAERLSIYLVERRSEAALARLTPLYVGLAVLLAPATWLLAKAMPAEAVVEEEPEDEASEDEIQAYIDVGRREGILEPEDEELLMSIVDFGDTRVRSVMTPRVEMIGAPQEASTEELTTIFFESKHSRLPIYQGSIDHVVGVLHLRDLFEALQGDAQVVAAALTQEPYFVPDSKPLRELLAELQARSQQMAIVLDEYGGVAGLVTVEDLLEEIVGEISDEHDEDETGPVALGDGGWRLEGRTDLEDLEELLEIDFDAEELPYETVNGLVCDEMGYVPAVGESFAAYGLTFEVESADERRVTAVLVHRAPAEAEEEKA